jgi:hypothetical protein
MSLWIDTHCHLDASEFHADASAARARARLAGVGRLVHEGHRIRVGWLTPLVAIFMLAIQLLVQVIRTFTFNAQLQIDHD